MYTPRSLIALIIINEIGLFLLSGSVHLVVTSPLIFNVPFDYLDLFKNYDEFLGLMRNIVRELYRVLA